MPEKRAIDLIYALCCFMQFWNVHLSWKLVEEKSRMEPLLLTATPVFGELSYVKKRVKKVVEEEEPNGKENILLLIDNLFENDDEREWKDHLAAMNRLFRAEELQ